MLVLVEGEKSVHSEKDHWRRVKTNHKLSPQMAKRRDQTTATSVLVQTDDT